MTRKTKSPVELATDFVTGSIDSAQAAFGGEAGPAKESVEALTASAKQCQARLADLHSKGMAFLKTNTKAVMGFWRDAAAVKSPEALFTLQQDFFKAQSEVAMKQFQELNDVTSAFVRRSRSPRAGRLHQELRCLPLPKAA